MTHTHRPPAPYPPMVGLRVANTLLQAVVIPLPDTKPNQLNTIWYGQMHSIQERMVPFTR